MKILIAPDSFKGTLSAQQAAETMARGARQAFPQAQIVLMPLADGGEGTVDAFVAAVPGSRKLFCEVMGPLGDSLQAFYGLLGSQRQTAVVEMAAASGLTLVPNNLRDPRETTTYGVGELIGLALQEPPMKQVIVGLGGSATNDGGAGALQALGVSFYDGAGHELATPIRGKDVIRIARAGVQHSLLHDPNIEITIACDVTNPLYGPNGASFVFGPQKGASPEVARELDDALAGFAPILDDIRTQRGISADLSLYHSPVADIPGAGAAGGLAAGLMAYFPWAKIQPGIEIVLDTVQFAEAARTADLVLTGEGKLDSQTLSGKAVSGVVRHAGADHAPIIAFAGEVEEEAAAALRSRGLRKAVALVSFAASRDDAMSRAAEVLEKAVADTLAGLTLTHLPLKGHPPYREE